MATPIPILSDTLSAEEIYALLRQQGEVNLSLQSDGVTTRSVLSDPSVVAALIGAGATTMASIITLIGVIWSTRRKEKQAGEGTFIELKISKAAFQSLMQSQDPAAASLKKLVSTSGSERLQIPVTAEGEAVSSYADLLESVLQPEEVEHIAIMEDE